MSTAKDIVLHVWIKAAIQTDPDRETMRKIYDELTTMEDHQRIKLFANLARSYLEADDDTMLRDITRFTDFIRRIGVPL